ncbi:MAG: hypothetical protein ABEI75_01320 [Halobaculum sp.]
MGKVSVGLRGWRFDEDAIFTADGDWKPLESMPEDTRHRLVRLQVVIGNPCDACYLIHGESEIRRCNEATVVYGEPLDELLVCDDHEADFLYWFREQGGRELAGEETFTDAFHEWFDDGGRAPDGYAGLEHVERAPDDLPDLPDPQDVYDRESELLDEHDLPDTDDATDGSDATDESDGELNLDREYPG